MAITATGCGGGSSASSTPTVANVPTTGYPASPPPGATQTPSTTTANSVVFTIRVPASATTSASNSRKPAYISSNTQSVAIALTSVNSTVYSATPAKTVNCTSAAACTVTFSQIPTGNDGFTVTTYSTQTGSQTAATALSTNTVTATVATATVTTVPLVLQGIIKTFSMAVVTTLTPGSTLDSDQVTVTANDASGAQIVGSAPYNNGPIAITTDDTLGAITVTTASLTSPANAFFGYNGVTIANNAEHITGTVSGLTAVSAAIPVSTSTMTASMVGVPIDTTQTAFTGNSPYAVTSGTDSVVVAKFTQAGWGSALSKPFVMTSNTCVSTLPVVVVTANGTADTFNLTSGAGNAGSCVITFTGGGGQTNVINYAQSATGNGVSIPVSSIARKS